jgi:hypothetical protein
MKTQFPKFKTQNLRRYSKWLTPALATLVAFFCILVGTISYAETPEYAQIVQLNGDRLQFQLGSQRPEPARAGQQLRNNSQALIIPGNNSSWSTLAFITPQPKDSARMTVGAGPESRDTVFRFPCQSEGGLILVSWQQGSDRGCEVEGFRVGRRRNRNAQLPSSNNNITAQRNKNLLAQASDSDDVTVKPDANEEKFFEGIDTGNSINIIAIRGSFTVISQQFPQGKTLQQSEQYTYLGNGQGRIEPIDLRPVINSRPVQNFLNPNNWSSPDLPERVANSIGSQVNDLRTALGQPSQPVAGSGNYLRVVSGSGRVTRSEYPVVVPVGTSVSQVTGGYDPSSRKLTLDIDSRKVEISLNSPLNDGTTIPFTIAQIVPRYIQYGANFSNEIYVGDRQFPRLLKDALVKQGIESQGTLIKQGNQIQGQFISRGRWRFDREGAVATTGVVEGEFVLNLQPGSFSDIPSLKPYEAPEWYDVINGGW